jgi:hypothetical protein
MAVGKENECVMGGGPAFPVTGEGFCGMSIRDFFAAVAMHGIVGKHGGEHIGEYAYVVADRMLAARDKGSGS